jgi:hypothetical protein
MKIFCLFPLIFGLVLSAFSQPGNDPSTTANLELLLSVNTTPVASQPNDTAFKYHASFDLTIKNKGPNEYRPRKALRELSELVVSQQPSGNKLQWHWTDDGSDIKCVAAGEVRHLRAEWDSLNDAESGTYTVTATFDHRSDFQSRTFDLPPPRSPRSADIVFTGRLMGYYRLPDKQGFEFKGDLPCVPEKEKASPDAGTFFDNFPYQRNEHQIRVGMGDNFAPNYFGRAFANPDDGGDPPDTQKYGASRARARFRPTTSAASFPMPTTMRLCRECSISISGSSASASWRGCWPGLPARMTISSRYRCWLPT